MNNIISFDEWKTNEENKIKYSSKNKSITINKDEYSISKNDKNEINIIKNGEQIPIEDKATTKYVLKAIEASEEASDSKKSYEIDRKTGGIDDLKKSLKDVESKNGVITYNRIFQNAVKDLQEGEWKYIEIKNSKEIDDIFGIKTRGVGKGEVLISTIYHDTERHRQHEKGDNITIFKDEKEKKEIEVKSAGASIKVKRPSSQDYKTEDNSKFVCAYSIMKYICSRNLGNIFLVIFDNKMKSKPKIEDNNSEKNEVSSNINGKKNVNGFFVMNCGYSVGNTNQSEESAIELAKKIENMIEIVPLENKNKNLDYFLLSYDKEKEKIVCFVNGGNDDFINKYKK